MGDDYSEPRRDNWRSYVTLAWCMFHASIPSRTWYIYLLVDDDEEILANRWVTFAQNRKKGPRSYKRMKNIKPIAFSKVRYNSLLGSP